jgi:hypothetical protein
VRTSKVLLRLAIVGVLSMLVLPADGQVAANAPTVERFTLQNGIRVVVLTYPKSEDAAIFTFLPMGLVSGGPGQPQHPSLIARLVLRSTIPAGRRDAGARTARDHIELETHGIVEKWQRQLAHHARWIEGVAFTERDLSEAKSRISNSCRQRVRDLAKHDYAAMTWAQGYRHGVEHVELKASAENATLDELQQFGDAHLAVLDHVLVCIVSRLDRRAVEPIVRKQLGGIRSEAKPPVSVEIKHVSRAMTWDLNVRHLVLAWRIPGPDSKDYAALMTVIMILRDRFARDELLEEQTDMRRSGIKVELLELPEGYVFYISFSLRPTGSFKDVCGAIDRHLRALKAGVGVPYYGPAIASNQAERLSVPPNYPSASTLMRSTYKVGQIERSLGYGWAPDEYRCGANKAALVENLKTLTAEQICLATRTYLANDKCAVCCISPRKD